MVFSLDHRPRFRPGRHRELVVEKATYVFSVKKCEALGVSLCLCAGHSEEKSEKLKKAMSAQSIESC